MKKIKVFMFHFAGGNKYSYRFLQSKLQNYETIPLELPGRGNRFGEELLFDIHGATLDLLSQVKKHVQAEDKFIIYGHSMGARLGFCVVHKLEQLGFEPLQLIISGNAGPGIEREIIRYNLPDEEFKEELKKLGGMPDEFFEEEELYNTYAPIMRADFQVVELSNEAVSYKIKTPVFAMMGSTEENNDKLDNWKNYCENFESEILEGDHFFIYNHVSKIVNRIDVAVLY